ncbi:hypothetical protein R3W88_024344 [Solanum pinnatisectum]|uniref:Uncharacterized protein n=1 Tax=Solanum pinnatisectum TaxID=50273 RepID=A0AAV9M094_9SOLN|nr:hypothetical protein R3W88_024344 [Solanum pinnatisectum]
MKKKNQIKRRYWNHEEDNLLQKLVEEYGVENWYLISKLIPNRYGKSYRLRWCDKLSSQVDHQPFNPEEDDTIIKAYAQFGNQWALIARLLLVRTNNHPSMSEDLTFENPQLLLKRSLSIRIGTNPCSSYEFDLSNLDFSKFPQLCLYPPDATPGKILHILVVSPVISDPSTSLSPFESDLSNLNFSRFPKLSLYPRITSLGGIFPLSVVSLVISDPLTSLSLSLP